MRSKPAPMKLRKCAALAELARDELHLFDDVVEVLVGACRILGDDDVAPAKGTPLFTERDVHIERERLIESGFFGARDLSRMRTFPKGGAPIGDGWITRVARSLDIELGELLSGDHGKCHCGPESHACAEMPPRK